jgi:hypothetical protein
LTRATAGSFADAAGVGSCFWAVDSLESFEHPATIGKTKNATEIMAMVAQRGRQAPSLGPGADESCNAVI